MQASSSSTISPRKRLANRENARQSTGPRTPDGKRVASRNAIRHGLYATNPVLPGEDPADFDEFRQGLLDDLNPAGPLESAIAERAILLAWKLRRINDAEAQTHARYARRTLIHHLIQLGRLTDYNADDPFAIDRAIAAAREAGQLNDTPTIAQAMAQSLRLKSAPFERLTRHEQRLSNMFHRCLRELRDLRKTRAATPAASAPAQNEPTPAPRTPSPDQPITPSSSVPVKTCAPPSPLGETHKTSANHPETLQSAAPLSDKSTEWADRSLQRVLPGIGRG